MKLEKEIQESLYGRKKGGRYKVAKKEDRTWNNIVFDSKHEMEEFIPFTLLEKAGTVTELKRQVRFCLNVNGKHICDYIADWTCRDLDKRLCVYDAKGHETAEFVIKRKLFEACFPSLRLVCL